MEQELFQVERHLRMKVIKRVKRALTGKSGIRCGSIPSWSGLSDITIVSRDVGAVTVLCREGINRMGHVHVRIGDWDIHGCLGLRAPVRGGRTKS